MEKKVYKAQVLQFLISVVTLENIISSILFNVTYNICKSIYRYRVV